MIPLGILGTAMSTALIGWAIAWARTRTAADSRELRRTRQFLDQLRELAYTHRELECTFAVIVTDEIRRFETKEITL